MLNSTKTWQEEEQQFINQSAKDINKELSRTWQEELENLKIFECIGEASMCWKPRPSNEVFDGELAIKIGHKLEDDIKQFITNIRKQDEAELIKSITHAGGSEEEIANNFKQLIKEYYEK